MKIKKNMSPFLKSLGDTPKLRVLDFLIDNDLFDYNMTEIARGSEVSYNSLISFFDDFIKNEIVVRTRRQGKSELYKLNTDKFLEYTQELTGAPLDLLRSDDEVKKIRENIAKAQAAQAQVAMQKDQAGTLKDVETAKSISAGR